MSASALSGAAYKGNDRRIGFYPGVRRLALLVAITPQRLLVVAALSRGCSRCLQARGRGPESPPSFQAPAIFFRHAFWWTCVALTSSLLELS